MPIEAVRANPCITIALASIKVSKGRFHHVAVDEGNSISIPATKELMNFSPSRASTRLEECSHPRPRLLWLVKIRHHTKSTANLEIDRRGPTDSIVFPSTVDALAGLCEKMESLSHPKSMHFTPRQCPPGLLKQVSHRIRLGGFQKQATSKTFKMELAALEPLNCLWVGMDPILATALWLR